MFRCLLLVLLVFVSQSLKIDTNNENLKYVGRFAMEDGHAGTDWPGNKVSMRIQNQSGILQYHISVASNRKYAYVRTFLDDETEGTLIKIQTGTNDYNFPQTLTNGLHTVSIQFIDENSDDDHDVSQNRELWFQGFTVSDTATLDNNWPVPKLKFVSYGDSDSVGYGQIISDCHVDHNGAWPSHLARVFGAEHYNIGISGITVSVPDESLIPYIKKVLPFGPISGNDWDYSNDHPDLLFALIGPNDFLWEQDLDDVEKAYGTLVDTLRSDYSNQNLDIMYICGGSGSPNPKKYCPQFENWFANRPHDHFLPIDEDEWTRIQKADPKYTGCDDHWTSLGASFLMANIVPKIVAINPSNLFDYYIEGCKNAISPDSVDCTGKDEPVYDSNGCLIKVCKVNSNSNYPIFATWAVALIFLLL